jgi:hypothetical protein
MINNRAINVGMSVDFRSWREQLAQVAAGSKDALHETINKQSFYVAVEAKEKTPTTNRATIERELNVVGYNLEFGKRGKVLNRRKQGASKNAIFGSKLIHLIINRRRGRQKEKGLYGPAMRDATNKFMAARFRSVGTLKAGWNRAINMLGNAVGFKADRKRPGESSFVRGVSQVKLAKPGWNPECRITYNVNSFDKKHTPYIDRRIGAALSGALVSQAKFMAKRLREGLVTGIKKKLKPAPMTRSQAVAEIQRVMAGK